MNFTSRELWPKFIVIMCLMFLWYRFSTFHELTKIAEIQNGGHTSIDKESSMHCTVPLFTLNITEDARVGTVLLIPYLHLGGQTKCTLQVAASPVRLSY